jgi:small-conductance mechanosensitive channel/CRP-like cAMP-binding protein
MDYWRQLQTAAGMGGEYHWVLLGVVLVAFLLAQIVPSARARMRGSVVMALLSLLGLLFCALMLERGMSTRGGIDARGGNVAYRWIHFTSQMLLAIAIINMIGVFVFRVLLAQLRLEPPPILRDAVVGAAYIAIAFALLSWHNVNLSGIVATSAVVTAVIGFSLQDTLGNIMGGIALQMERSVAVGDWIHVNDVEGVVREIRWRQTSIETRNRDTVVIPNSQLMKTQVTVLGRRIGKPKAHRILIRFNVDFRTTPTRVIEIVQTALRSEPIPNVANDPLPDCILSSFEDSYAGYTARYWLTDFMPDEYTNSDVRIRIFFALQRAGVHLSIPAESVFLTMVGRARKARKAELEVRRRTAALRNASIFQPLTDEEQRELADRLKLARFARGEVLTRQGNEAHHLYIIASGEAEMCITAGGETRRVETLRAGDCFGEMGLMLGEPRHATVTALEEVTCYRLDKEDFLKTLQYRPEIADGMSRLLTDRKLKLDAIREGLTQSAVHDRAATTQQALLNRIRTFFTLH